MGSTGFRRRFPEKVWEGFGAEPGRVQQGSGEGSGEGLGGFGVEPGQVQQRSAEYYGEGSRKPWCKAKPGSMGSGGCRSQVRSGRSGSFNSRKPS